MYLIRFDMRAPDHGAPTTELYPAALEMASWGEENGCVAVVVSEHHSSPDGYLPSPLILATAIAARTSRTFINVAAVLLPLYDPIKLAEDMVVLDILSRGRVSYTLGMGYRDEEYAMFGIERKRRGKILEAKLEALQKALSAEPFEYEGRPVHVTPRPFTPGGPTLAMGGGSLVAARRAARFGLDLFASAGTPGLEEAYREEAKKCGREPGSCRVPGDEPTTVFVAEDVERAWEKIGPYLLHDAKTYGAWLKDQDAASKSVASTIDELRAERGAYRIVTPAEAAEMIRKYGILSMQPLCGGAPPELGWESLRLVADKVVPSLA